MAQKVYIKLPGIRDKHRVGPVFTVKFAAYGFIPVWISRPTRATITPSGNLAALTTHANQAKIQDS